MSILRIEHLSKSFGSKTVVDDISFEVQEGKVFGFIGQNGAGKTTTMKMILGLLPIDKGEIFVNDCPVKYGETATNKFIGYLPDVPEFYGFMTPREYLNLCGEITGMSKEQTKKRGNELLEMVGLADVKKKIHGFSRGMKQRLGIAQALLNSPKLLICDEPTSALDPVGRKEILDILSTVKSETTVLFSTHILSDVERIGDEIAFLHKGKIALEGNLEEIRTSRGGDGLEIEFLNADDANLFMSMYRGGSMENKTRVRFEKRKKEDVIRIMQLLSTNNISPLRLEMMEPDLEDVFMEVVGK